MRDRFVVTHLDLEAGYGYVRQESSTDGKALLTKPIRFEFAHVVDVFASEEYGTIAWRGPSAAVTARVPQIGMQLVGAIAREAETPNSMELGTNGLPFLRSWCYADQQDAAQDIANSGHPLRDADEDPDDEIDPASLAEIEHGRRHEMY